MSQKQTQNNDNFWVDDTFNAEVPHSSFRMPTTLFAWYARIIMGLFGIAFPFVIFLYLNRTIAWIWLFFCVFIYVRYFFQKRDRDQNIKKAHEIQANAMKKTGATIINSAIHVAGHPFLTRNQPIVLALIKDHLSIFNYESPQPIDTIYLRDLNAIHTVVYDNERIPHTNVIDSTAQALQMSFTKNGKNITCLLRQMRQVRPIDWYHAIERARYMEQINNPNSP